MSPFIYLDNLNILIILISLIILITLSKPTLLEFVLVSDWETISNKKGSSDRISITFSGLTMNAKNVSPKLVHTASLAMNSKRNTTKTTVSRSLLKSEYEFVIVSSKYTESEIISATLRIMKNYIVQCTILPQTEDIGSSNIKNRDLRAFKMLFDFYLLLLLPLFILLLFRLKVVFNVLLSVYPTGFPSFLGILECFGVSKILWFTIFWSISSCISLLSFSKRLGALFNSISVNILFCLVKLLWNVCSSAFELSIQFGWAQGD